ncbi:hypothetical protein SDRG_01617 [Saprolegnia diclina VS20]|uniref:Uncharacterized protein n=1 Tax=Saprolegnia diclina (strain VS20) TaxID=1156394 RepID=T0QTZ3_SAPDV|nr:hypothetical protein SDRG_01617 [Saprolegnia diclina VS20]EQC41659.1 hypothetical protein SDRG_01617 [Saprolegnia diclina VS20]|eukprot:XP_008605373.1 hypothetical protein SDRG_01617 [Saprolegnia diclina VS20]
MSSLVRTALELYAEHRREKSKFKRFLSWLTFLSLSSFFFHPDGMVWVILQHALTLLHHTAALVVASNSISVVLCLVLSTFCAGALLHWRHDTRGAVQRVRTPSSKKTNKRRDRKARPAVLSPRRAPASPRITLVSPPQTPKLAEVYLSTTAKLPHLSSAQSSPVLIKSTPEQQLPEVRPANVVKRRESPRKVRSPKASMSVTTVPNPPVTKYTNEKSSSQPRQIPTPKRKTAPTIEANNAICINSTSNNNNSSNNNNNNNSSNNDSSSNNNDSSSNISTVLYPNKNDDNTKNQSENVNNCDVAPFVSASSQPCDEPQRDDDGYNVARSATDESCATETNKQSVPEIDEPPATSMDEKPAADADEPPATEKNKLVATESDDQPSQVEPSDEPQGATPEIVVPFTKVELFAFLAEPKLTVPDIRRHVASGAIDHAMVTAMLPAEFAAAKIPQLVVRMLSITIMSMRPRALSPPPSFTRSTSAHVAPPPGFAAIGTPPRTYHAPPRSRSFPVTKSPSVQELNHMYERDMERISNQMTMNVLD